MKCEHFLTQTKEVWVSDDEVELTFECIDCSAKFKGRVKKFMTLEDELPQIVPTLFNGDKRMSASIFWRRMEEYAISHGEKEVTGSIYRGVAELFQQGVLGLSDGCYYLRGLGYKTKSGGRD
jgi:hypothetical protein